MTKRQAVKSAEKRERSRAESRLRADGKHFAFEQAAGNGRTAAPVIAPEARFFAREDRWYSDYSRPIAGRLFILSDFFGGT